MVFWQLLISFRQFYDFFNIFQLAWHETGAIHYFDEDRDVFFSQTIEKIITIFFYILYWNNCMFTNCI